MVASVPTSAPVARPIGGVGDAPGMAGGVPTNLPQPINGSINPTQATQANPYLPSGVTVPTTPGTPTNGVNWVGGDNSVIGDFQDTYGKGTGTAITGVLSGLGTKTDAAVTATTNATQLAADKEYANIRATQAASGITSDSSAAALAAGDFYSTVNTNLQSTIAGMELGEEGTLLQTLLGEGSAHGTDESTWNSIMNGITDFGNIGTAITGLIPKG